MNNHSDSLGVLCCLPRWVTIGIKEYQATSRLPPLINSQTRLSQSWLDCCSPFTPRLVLAGNSDCLCVVATTHRAAGTEGYSPYHGTKCLLYQGAPVLDPPGGAAGSLPGSMEWPRNDGSQIIQSWLMIDSGSKTGPLFKFLELSIFVVSV